MKIENMIIVDPPADGPIRAQVTLRLTRDEHRELLDPDSIFILRGWLALEAKKPVSGFETRSQNR